MDDIDRPGNLPSQPTPGDQLFSDMGNRPPVAMDQGDDFDEVDRPSPRSETSPVLDSTDDAMFERPNPPITTQRQESEILTSISSYDETPSVYPPVENKIKEEEEEEEILPTIDAPFDVNKFNLEEMSPPSPPPTKKTGDGETTDGPPTSSTTTTPETQTDGPFTSTFFKPAQPTPVLIQHRSERKTRDGIVVKHTTFYPKPFDNKSQLKTSSDYASQIYSDSYYKMDCFPRGKLTLINVKYFTRSSGMSEYPREGTNRDADGLTQLFLDLGFVVERFDNPSKKEIMSIVKGAANDNYSDKACCACAIMSHGEEGLVYGSDDFVKIKDITKAFQTRGLAGKPKFFLIQACQGSEYMNPLDAVDGPGRGMTDEDIALALPVEADFLYAYSTVPGYYSWRNSRRGSWFMEALVQVFRENAHRMDVLRMLVKVNDIVSFRKSRTDDVKTDNKRQIASLVTQMRKDFFLFPPYGPLPK